MEVREKREKPARNDSCAYLNPLECRDQGLETSLTRYVHIRYYLDSLLGIQLGARGAAGSVYNVPGRKERGRTRRDAAELGLAAKYSPEARAVLH